VEQRKMDLPERLASFRRHSLLIVAALVAMTFGAVAFSIQGREGYSASSRVVVRPVLVEGTQTPQDAFDALQDPFGLTATIDTQVELALGQVVTKKVDRMLPPVVTNSASVKAQSITDEILQIEASATNPTAAVRVANAYATAFLEARRDIVRDAFALAVTDAQRRIAALTDRVEELTARLAQPLAEGERVSLEAELRDVSDSRATLVTQAEQLALDGATVSGGGEIVQSARSAAASGPTPARDAAVGIVLGLALGLGLAVLRSNTDRRVFTLDAAADATGVEVLAAIPRRSRGKRSTSRVRVYGTARTPRGAGEAAPQPPVMSELRFSNTVASSLSILREALVVRGLGSELRCLVVLSPEPGEGSAFLAAGLSWACAQAGLRTIAVDGAAGLGEREALFGSRGPDGVGRVLADTTGVSNAILPTSIPGLHFLPAGPPRHGHDDALASVRPGTMVSLLARGTDVVVVRAPAVSSGGDAMAWATEADAILLAIRAGTTRPGAASRSSRSLRSLGLPLLGTVLTASSIRDGTVGLPSSTLSKDEAWRPGVDAHLSLAGSGSETNGSRSRVPEGTYRDPGRPPSARKRRR
jgi:Mrp family chromosome partitioning ATPase/capsular polysaccharide biosynthesis protein